MLITTKTRILGLIFIVAALTSCRTFNSNRMFKTDHSIVVDSIQRQIANAEKNYIIQQNDYLGFSIFSSGGERLIDPDYEMGKSQTVVVKPEPQRYLVRNDGEANFPMIGNVKVEGLTLAQADSLLSAYYAKYYRNPFVITKLLNKRVVIFGPAGGKIIPLENDNMNLIEVIALYGGIQEYGKAYNIRVIRGDLKNPNVSIVDLSTIAGMKTASLDVQPNDIIYIESSRRFLTESVRDLAPVIGLVTNIILTIVLLTRK